MYQIYALRYGERTTTACQCFHREPSHEPLTLYFSVWLVLGGPHLVVVDAGAPEGESTARGLADYVSLSTDLPEMLAAFDTVETHAGPGLVVAGHDPEVAARFERVDPRVARIA